MAVTGRQKKTTPQPLAKCPTGILGLDEITGGGLPRGRPTLICGGPGCGKSLMSMEFLVRGITEFGESGVLMTFEEPRAMSCKTLSHLVSTSMISSREKARHRSRAY